MFYGIGVPGMVVLIVAIIVFGRIYAARRGLLHGRKRGWGPGHEDDNDRLRAEIAQLKERVATLERLAVDRRQRLADEIDALGDR